MEDGYGHTPTGPGEPGQGAPASVAAPEPVYSLDLNQVSALFDAAQLPRSRRTLLRYCQNSKLDCTKVETMHGEQYFVSEDSVHRLIAEILERERFVRPPQAPTHYDMHPDRTGQAPAGLAADGPETTPFDSAGQPPTDPGEPGQGTPAPDSKADERLIQQLEDENALLRNQLEVKDKQIERMNGQIDDLIERGREDKLLIQNFQRKLGMLAPPAPERAEASEHAPPFLDADGYVDSERDERGGML